MTSSPTSALRRSRTRSLALATGLALAATLTACGGDSGDDSASDPAASSSPSADDSAPSPSETPSETPTGTPEPGSGTASGESIEATGSAGVTEATVVSGTEVGGAVSELAFALDTDQARADFAAQFERGFGDEVAQAAVDAAEQAPAATPYAATVAVGCEGPSSVAVEAGEAGFQVTPTIPKNTKQCLAPMTYVVVFAAPNA